MKQAAIFPRRPVPLRTEPAAAGSAFKPTTGAKSGSWRTWRSTAIIALVVPGLFATMALPAYAFPPSEGEAAGTSALQSLKESGAQSLSVDADVTANAVARDGYSATTKEELAAVAAAKAAATAAAEAASRAAADASARRATFNSTQKSFSGPSAEDLLKKAPAAQPNSSLSQIYSVALKYQGVPYVYGGATPAGFDCSGFIKYVYAQFGVNMPHSSTAQGNMGTRISIQDAVPGDLIVSAGHIGFYAGNNKILHASRPGTPLRIGPIYAKNWWVVRI